MDTLLLLLPLEKQNLSSNSHLNPTMFYIMINKYIQQYKVPGHKADTIYATMLVNLTILVNQGMNK